MTDQNTPPLDLDGLERLAKAATGGEWQYGCDDYDGVFALDEPQGNIVCVPPPDEATASFAGWPANAAFIAAANPATILALISQAREAERMRVALERIATVDMGGGFLGALACRQVANEALAPATGGGDA